MRVEVGFLLRQCRPILGEVRRPRRGLLPIAGCDRPMRYAANVAASARTRARTGRFLISALLLRAATVTAAFTSATAAFTSATAAAAAGTTAAAAAAATTAAAAFVATDNMGGHVLCGGRMRSARCRWQVRVQLSYAADRSRRRAGRGRRRSRRHGAGGAGGRREA